jgi:hypothetical protein
MMERKMVTGQGYGMGIGGCNMLCPMATGLSLVALFFLFVSVEDRSLHWTLVKLQTYYSEHMLAYGSGKACYSLVMGSGSFQTDWLETGIGEGLSTALRPGLKRGGLESKFGRGPGPLDKSGTSWSCLCLGCKRDMCFLGTQLGTLIWKSPFLHDDTTWLRSGTAVRTRIRTMEKWFWLLNPCLK